MSALVVPSRAFQRLVHPRRDNPLARPKRVDPVLDFAAAKKRWQAVREHWSKGWSRRSDARVALENAADELLNRTELPGVFDIEVFAVAERMLHGGGSLVSSVAARFGVALALRMKVRSLDWSVASGREQQVWWWMLAEAKGTVPRLVDDGWQAVRVATCSADASAYVEARDEAGRLRDAETEVVKRVAIDFAFPSEGAWSLADMRALLAKPDFAKLTYLTAPLFACLIDEDACTQFLQKCGPRQSIGTLRFACDLVAALPPDVATRVLLLQTEVALSARHYDAELQKLACALTSIVSEPMARGLAKYVRHARFERYLVSYFEEHAALARLALGDVARGKSVMADAARHLIAGHARASEPDASEPGATDDAPAVLRNPPWTQKTRRWVLALDRLPFVETIAWASGERERFATMPPIAGHTNAQIRPIEDAELVEFDALPEAQKYVDVWPRWNNKQWMLVELPDDRRLPLWQGGRARLYHRPPCFMLARFGETALGGLFARDPFDAYDDRMLVSCLRVDSPRAALVCARVLARRRAWRVRAKAWLREHAEAAAIGLIPVALGREGRARRTAGRALQYLASEQPDAVRDVAARYGDAAREAVFELAFGDPLLRIDVRGQPPRWLRLDTLPRVRMRDGRPLPRHAVGAIVDMLRSRGEDLPYAGIAVVREALDARSLADLAWALFLTWVLHGRKRMHEWLALSLAAFPVDANDVVARLGPYIRDWAHADPRACITLVDVLTALGGEAATLELVAIADAARAPILLEAVAEALGTRTETAPYAGLDERGEATLDLGARTVRVVLDESLTPYVVLEDGRRLLQVPRPRKDDDPRLAALATARFNRLRRDAKIVTKTGLRRLERDMIAGRRFTVPELEARFAHHPLLRHAASRLVWESLSATNMPTFRITSDGSCADERDLPITLDEDAEVSVIHPINMAEATRSRWGTLFAEYEILQPFEQIGRLTFTGDAKEAADILKSTLGVMIEARALLSTLDAHGWRRPGGRRVSSAWCEIKQGVRASFTFAPGIALDQVRTAPPQKLSVINTNALDTLTRVELSELIRTVLTLRA